MTCSENKSHNMVTQPSQRSAFQATAATVEHPNRSPKIIEKVEAKSEEGL